MPKTSARRKKSARVSKKQKQRIVRTVTAALLLFLSVGFLVGISLYRTFTKKSATATSVSSYDVTNAEISTIVIASVENMEKQPLIVDSMHLVMFDKAKKKIVSHSVNVEDVVEMPGKYGKEKLSKVLAIGMLESSGFEESGIFLENTIMKKFAFDVDRFLVVNKNSLDKILDVFTKGELGALVSSESINALLFESKTNITLNEFYSFTTFANSLTSDRFISTDYVDDSYLQNLTFDSKTSQEKASVAVLNGTKIPGVASYVGRVISNAGGYIITVSNAKTNYDKSMLIVRNKDLHVVKDIVKFFGIENIVLSDDININENVADRADVTIIIGIDIAKLL